MTPILIFQSISSFNPDLREINFYEKYCQFIVWGPKLQAVWRNKGSANRPKMDQLENFSTISYSKSKLKGGPFYEKNCQLMYFRPKRMKGGEVIRPFVAHRVTESQSHRVTESQSHRVTESHHFHSLYGWVKFFMPIFN